MTLGELIVALGALDPDLPINGDGRSSYRGYYDQLAVEPGESTVGTLLGECRAAVGKHFDGYKGGDYRMTERTAVWFSEWGHNSGLGIFGVTVLDGAARLQTGDVSAYA